MLKEPKTGLSNTKNRKMWHRALRIAREKFPNPNRGQNVQSLSEARWAEYYGFSSVVEYRQWRRDQRARQLKMDRKIAQTMHVRDNVIPVL
ncbi:MAG: hypothetical protein AAB573_03840 [Patescibacteria group bacterium]